MLSKNEEKIWEKPWSNEDLKTFSTSWSLAGDSGLLLSLKQMSENLIFKSVKVEKKLQKLIHDEQQCQVKLNNATSSFLMLENSQFIENRVYEHETIVDTVNENTTQEKTKEEKELELFNKMTEACEVGMTIMDTYFDKLNAKDIKKNRNADSEEEDDDEEEEEVGYNENENAEDLIIYETKDPYVLRSLPYLIGSQAFLENDHVGLKDLDSEDEEDVDLDDEEEDTEEESFEESQKEYSTDDEDLFDSSEKKTSEIVTKEKSIAFDNEDDEEDNEDDGGLFGSNKKKKASIFDDDSDSDDNNDLIEQSKLQPTSQKQSENLFDDENSESDEPENNEPLNPPKPQPLDFAAELSRKLANKNKPVDQVKTTEVRAPEAPISKPKAPEITVKNSSNLFDDDSDENDIFASSNPVQKKSIIKKGLFDDSDESDNDEEPLAVLTKLLSIKKEVKTKESTEQKSNINSALNDLFSKNPKEPVLESDDNFNSQIQSSKKEAPKAPTSKKFSIFDSDNDDDDDSKQTEAYKPPPPKVKSSLFDDEDDDLFSPLEQTKPVNKKTEKKVSLFSDSSDTSPEDLFSNKSRPDTVKKPVKTNTKSLFDSTDSSSDNQFNKPLNNKAEEKDELFTAPRKNSDLSKPVKKSESPKPKKKTPLFSSSTDDDNSDLFQTIKKVEPTKKVEKPQKKATSLFEDSSEEIFTETKTVSNVEEKKTSLFDDSSDELFADNNNGEDKKLKQEPENNPNKLDQPRKSIVKKDLLFNPAALANSSIFKKMADKNEDKIVSDPLEKIDSSEQVSNDDVLQKPIENAKIEEKQKVKDANEISTKKKSLFDESSDELFKPSDKKNNKDSSIKKTSLFDDSSDELFTVKSSKEPTKQAPKTNILKSDSSEDLFTVSDKKEYIKKEVSNEEPIKLAPKKDIFKSDSSEDLFKSPSKKEPAPKRDIFKSDSSEDLFTSPSKKEPIKPSPKADIFKSDSSEDLFTSPIKKEETKPVVPDEESTKSAKKPDIFKSDSSENLFSEQKSPKTEPVPQKISVKNIGKNLVFGPGALASSGLFKKLSEKAKAENSDNEKSDHEANAPVAESNESFDLVFPSVSLNKPSKTIEAEPSMLTDDPFGDIKVDKAFSEKSFKAAQRDRIQVSGRKKRPPTNRKAAVKPETKEETLEDTVKSIDPIPDSDPIPGSKLSSCTEEPDRTNQENAKKTDTIFDKLADDDFKDLDIFKPKKKTAKGPRPSIFEDDTDIFSDMPTASKPHVPKPKKETKQKERKSLVPSNTDIFATLSDDEDVFNIVADKKKVKKTTEVLDDPLNFFS